MWDQLKPLIERVFAADGLLTAGVAGRSFQHNPQQLEYALAAGQSLCQKPDGMSHFSAIQAGTGTGKTLGYLVPLALYAALSGKRVGVSTFTRHLQSQVLRDCEVATALAALLTDTRLSVRKRVGRANYLSAHGIHRVRDALHEQGAGHAELLEFLRTAEAWAAQEGTSGILRDLLEELGINRVPSGISESLLCIQPDDPPTLAESKYRRDVEASHAADIVVFNHATVTASAFRWGEMLRGDRGIEALIIDEADRLEGTAESMMGSDLSLYGATQIAERVDKTLGEALGKPSISQLSKLLELMNTGADIVAAEDSIHYMALNACVITAARQWERITSAVAEHLAHAPAAKRSAVTDTLMDAIELREALSFISDTLNTDQPDRSVAITWSPIRRFPSIRTGSANPGQIFGRLWRSIKREGEAHAAPAVRNVLLTSATLSSDRKPAPECYADFLMGLGLSPRGSASYVFASDLSLKLEPRNFGSLRFVLPDLRLPNPGRVLDSNRELEQYELDPVWVSYALRMIETAHQQGGRALVLCPSFRDVQTLSEANITDGPLLTQRRGQRLDEVVPSFLAHAKSVLITASAWEGLDLPGQIAHVVIPRIPFENSDSTTMVLLKNHLMKRMAPQVVNGIIQRRVMTRSIRKLSQGIGRLIRQASDSGTIWIADPRFPLPETASSVLHPAILEAVKGRKVRAGLIEAIPRRFQQDSFENSEILTLEGDLLGMGDGF